MYGNTYKDSAYLTEKKLKFSYLKARKSIIRYQNISTGLFCVDDASNICHLRDSLFCCYTLWGLSEGYKRFDCSNGIQYELSHSAIKGMRGILYCWMQQTERLEKFKYHQSIENALSSSFDVKTGLAVKNNDLKDRQIYIAGLFIIFITQMITSGLQIIYCKSEVNFIQNLIYYIERTYRSPGYNIWADQTKTGLHSCTIGIVKAALEAANGFNLYGPQGSPLSVLYVDVDAHNRNSNTLKTLLDFEINEFNLEILLAVGWPSFAIHDSEHLTHVVENVAKILGVKLLEGDNYAMPIYSIYCILMMINGVFWRNEQMQVDYTSLLETIAENMDFNLRLNIPESEGILIESILLGDKYSEFNLLINSLSLLYLFLNERIIHRSDVDPLRRYLPGSKRPKKYGRHTHFQGGQPNMVIQVVQISESKSLQAILLDFGIQTQTPNDIYPIEIWKTSHIVRLFENLGSDPDLKLTGRPQRPFGFLSSSKVFKICGKTVICFPLMFDIDDFFLWNDTKFVMNSIKHTLRDIARNWKLGSLPMFCFIIYESMMRGSKAGICLDLLSKIKNGFVDGVKVVAGRAQNLLANSAIEYLDFINSVKGTERFDEVYGNSTFDGFLNLSSKSLDMTSELSINDYDSFDVRELTDIAKNDGYLLLDRVFSLVEISKRTKSSSESPELKKCVSEIYEKASSTEDWHVARLCSALMGKTVHSLAPLVTTILGYGKSVTFGIHGCKTVTVREPTSPSQIIDWIYQLCMSENPAHVSLQQEVLFNLGVLISDNPNLFHDIVNIRIGSFIRALEILVDNLQIKSKLFNLSPSRIHQLLVDLLMIDIQDKSLDGQFGNIRVINALLGRVPSQFFHQIKKILKKFKSGLYFQGLTISENSEYSNFTAFITDFLEQVNDPAYQQIIIETLTVIASFVPGLGNVLIEGPLKIEMIIESAVELYKSERMPDSQEIFTDFSNLPFYGNDGMGSFLSRSFMKLLSSESVSYVKHLN